MSWVFCCIVCYEAFICNTAFANMHVLCQILNVSQAASVFMDFEHCLRGISMCAKERLEAVIWRFWSHMTRQPFRLACALHWISSTNFSFLLRNVKQSAVLPFRPFYLPWVIILHFFTAVTLATGNAMANKWLRLWPLEGQQLTLTCYSLHAAQNSAAQSLGATSHRAHCLRQGGWRLGHARLIEFRFCGRSVSQSKAETSTSSSSSSSLPEIVPPQFLQSSTVKRTGLEKETDSLDDSRSVLRTWRLWSVWTESFSVRINHTRFHTYIAPQPFKHTSSMLRGDALDLTA